MRRLIPPVLHESDLPVAILTAARLDGYLWKVHDGFSPVDEPDGPILRLSALEARAPTKAVAIGRTAAWVHGASTSIRGPVELCTLGQRSGGRRDRFRRREIALERDDIEDFTGTQLRTTTRERTALDLAIDPVREHGDTALVIALCNGSRDEIAKVRRRLELLPTRPGKLRGIAWLRAAEEQTPQVAADPPLRPFG